MSNDANPITKADLLSRHIAAIKELGLTELAKDIGVSISNPYLDQFLTTDNDLNNVKETVIKLTDKQLPIIIIGESGTGKELIAHALHGDRKGQFIAVNCAGVPGELLESEFFGHERGAFSGAYNKQDGYIAQAQDGTLFLDEIGDLPHLLQAKLLRFLQDKRYRPIGSTKEQQSNCRIISATNQNIPGLIGARRFRADLYYRLKGSIIRLKSLKERPKEDIELLVNKYSERKEKTELIDRLYEQVQTDVIKGNVRELLNVINEDNCLI